MTSPSEAPHVTFERRERVGLITLNRPERLNAWSPEMARLVRDHIERCNEDPAVGAVVLTGAGRGFCSGADLRRDRAADGGRRPAAEGEPLTAFMQRSKPLIAAINGPAIGVGFTLTLCCDLRIASENARVSMRFVRIGLTPELGSTFILPQVTGLGAAAEMILTGRIIDAQEALRIGAVNRSSNTNSGTIPRWLTPRRSRSTLPATSAGPRGCLRNAANATSLGSAPRIDLPARRPRSEAFAEAGRAFAEKREPNIHGEACYRACRRARRQVRGIRTPRRRAPHLPTR